MNKKKIALLAMSLCMIAILAVGGSLAYLTDTDNQTNTFTAGKVGINLDEVVRVEDPATDNLIPLIGEDGKEVRTEGPQEYHLHPNMTVAKDPTITVDADSEDCYVGAIVTVSGDLYGLYPMDNDSTKSLIEIKDIASGGLLSQTGGWGTYAGLEVFHNANYAVHQKNTIPGKEWKLYVFMKQPQAKNATIELFEQLNISKDFNNEDMAKLNGMKIEVQAYAVQSAGFDVTTTTTGCYDALIDAFASVWKF